MLIGIMGAAGTRATTSTSYDLYAGAIAVFDFQSGIYRINGIDTALTSMLDRVDNVTGGKLVCDMASSSGPNAMLAAVLDQLPTDSFTLYAEYTHYSGSGSGVFTFAREDGDWFEAAIYSYSSYVKMVDSFEITSGFYREPDAAAPAFGSLRRVACTHTSGSSSISANGSEPYTVSDANVPPAYVASVGYIGGGTAASAFAMDADIYRCFLYPAKPNTDLPLMTAA